MSGRSSLRVVVRRSLVAIVATSGFAALAAQPASAATVVNGDFEAGTLSGWTAPPSFDGDFPSVGGWFAYSGTVAPISREEEEIGEEEFEESPRSVTAPPQGAFGAISDENGPGTHILYQDIALEPGRTHTLSMVVYYRSEEPIAAPETLSGNTPGVPNQQYRIDVMRPTAPIASVSPADILTTIYRTVTGSPQTLAPTPVTADLTPFAGQTVRLRLAEVDNEYFFNAGADSVSIASSPPFNAFTFGKLSLNKKNGTGQLEVNVPNPGAVSAVDATSSTAKASASKKKKKKPALIKKAGATATAPGVVEVNLKPTSAGKKKMRETGKLAFKVSVAFTPTGGTAAIQAFGGKLKLTRKPRG